MKKLVLLFVSFLLVLAVAGCGSTTDNQSQTGQDQTSQNSQSGQAVQSDPNTPAKPFKAAPFDESTLKGKKVAIIETKYGKIYIELFPKEAPGTVKNFETLANTKHFYDGLTFHRVEPGFVVQGGDPKGNGTGGPGYTIKEELNSHKHLKGAVGMATQGTNTNTGGSQFYICLADQPSLDGQYTVFGQTLGGMDVVEQIKIGDKMDKVKVVDYK